MSNYTFFFDEALHDRKIGILDDGDFNFLKDASFDVYIGAFWGIRTKKVSNIYTLLESFENAQKQRYGLDDDQELKSTTIGKKNFRYGLRSLNHNSYCFYNDLFDMLHGMLPVVHITMISKMELYLRHFFQNFDIKLGINEQKLFYYSITKFIIVYGTEQLRNELLEVQNESDMDHFIDSMISELQTIINKTRGIPRKSGEVAAFKQLIQTLKNSNKAKGIVEKQYPFEYSCSFDGLCRLLEEKRINISTTEIIIDEEINTLKAAQLYRFEKTKSLKSHQSIELRLSDWIAGFLGRMVVALNKDSGINEHYESIEELDEKDIVSKHLLSSEWFDINKDVFDLYQKAFQVFILDREYDYWATMTGSYSDSTVFFYSLLRYFGSYHDYDSYKCVTNQMHSEYFNSCACNGLSQAYLNMCK